MSWFVIFHKFKLGRKAGLSISGQSAGVSDGKRVWFGHQVSLEKLVACFSQPLCRLGRSHCREGLWGEPVQWAPGVQLLGLPLPRCVAQGRALAVAVWAAGARAGCAPVLRRAGLAEPYPTMSAKLPKVGWRKPLFLL